MKLRVYFPYVLDFPYILSFELVQTVMVYEPIRLRFAQLTRSMLASALRAESSKNKLAFTNNSLPERSRGRLGHVVPVDVLNAAATVADEVVVAYAFQIESTGAPLDGHFPHQTRLDQVPQIVIRRGPGRAGIHAVHGFEDLRSRRMSLVLHQEGHYGVALCSAPQPAAVQRPLNRLGVHHL